MTDDMVISPAFTGVSDVGDMVNVQSNLQDPSQGRQGAKTANRDTLELINNSTSLSSPIPDTSVYM
jgi:hypothetical protein